MLEPVALGLTGLNVSPLCFGTGTRGWNHRSNQSDLGVDRLATFCNTDTNAALPSGIRPTSTEPTRISPKPYGA